MSTSVMVSLLFLCSLASAWTGKVDEIYDVEQQNANFEGIIWFDDNLYGGTTRAQNIFRIDPDDLSTSKAAKVDGTSESATGLGSQIMLALCYSDDKDAIYGCFSSLSATEDGGIIMWDKDDLTFKKAYPYPGITFGNDCIVSDEQKQVYFTSSVDGRVIACDLDLDSCTSYVNGGDLTPTQTPILTGFPIGANGIEYFDDSDNPFLIVGNYDDGKLVKVNVSKTSADRTMTRVTVTDPSNLMSGVSNLMLGADGLARVDDDVLIVVTTPRVILLESNDNFATAEIKKVVDTLYIEPDGSATAALKYGDRASKGDIQIYVSFPSFTSLFAGADQTTFKMALLRFSDEDVDDLDWAGVLVASLLVWFF